MKKTHNKKAIHYIQKNKEKIYKAFLLFIFVGINIILSKDDLSSLTPIYIKIQKLLPDNPNIIDKLKDIAKLFKQQSIISTLQLSLVIFSIISRVFNIYKILFKNQLNSEDLKNLNISLTVQLIIKKVILDKK